MAVSKVSIESGGDTDIEPRMKESEGKTMRFQKGIKKLMGYRDRKKHSLQEKKGRGRDSK